MEDSDWESRGSPGSAFSQCSDAVMTGPPKKGRRRAPAPSPMHGLTKEQLRNEVNLREALIRLETRKETLEVQKELSDLKESRQRLVRLLQKKRVTISRLESENEALRRKVVSPLRTTILKSTSKIRYPSLT